MTARLAPCPAWVPAAPVHRVSAWGVAPPHFLGCVSVSKAEVYNLRPEDIYLVHDDLDKALGKVAIKLGGSARYGVDPALWLWELVRGLAMSLQAHRLFLAPSHQPGCVFGPSTSLGSVPVADSWPFGQPPGSYPGRKGRVPPGRGCGLDPAHRLRRMGCL